MIKIILENLENGETHEEEVEPSDTIYIGYTDIDGTLIYNISSIGSGIASANVNTSHPLSDGGNELKRSSKVAPWQMTETDPWEFL